MTDFEIDALTPEESVRLAVKKLQRASDFFKREAEWMQEYGAVPAAEEAYIRMSKIGLIAAAIERVSPGAIEDTN